MLIKQGNKCLLKPQRPVMSLKILAYESQEKGMATQSRYPCLQNLRGQKSVANYSPWDHEESDTTEQLALPLNSKFAILIENMSKYIKSSVL